LLIRKYFEHHLDEIKKVLSHNDPSKSRPASAQERDGHSYSNKFIYCLIAAVLTTDVPLGFFLCIEQTPLFNRVAILISVGALAVGFASFCITDRKFQFDTKPKSK
jgi:hypothetical protein